MDLIKLKQTDGSWATYALVCPDGSEAKAGTTKSDVDHLRKEKDAATHRSDYWRGIAENLRSQNADMRQWILAALEREANPLRGRTEPPECMRPDPTPAPPSDKDTEEKRGLPKACINMPTRCVQCGTDIVLYEDLSISQNWRYWTATCPACGLNACVQWRKHAPPKDSDV